jgi:hypothetical protein
MNKQTIIIPKGEVEIIIDSEDGCQQMIVTNAVLKKGREALAASLANDIGDSYNFYISRMLFGDGGTTGGVPKFVDAERNGLFGITRASKSVASTVDPNNLSQVVFTSVLAFTEANGYTLNEMALQMNNEDLYSMATFADLNKTSSIQITFNWRIFFA